MMYKESEQKTELSGGQYESEFKKNRQSDLPSAVFRLYATTFELLKGSSQKRLNRRINKHKIIP